MDPTRSPESRAARARRLLVGLGPAALIVVVALVELVAVTRVGAGQPSEADWRAASAALRARHQPGDLIVFAPGWIDPLGREYLGDLIPIDMAARMDAARYPVVWEVAAEGAQAAELAGESATDSARFGGLTLRRYQRAAPSVVTDFVAAFGGATVTGPSVGRPSVRLEEVGFAPHRCVRVIPAPDQTVEVRYPDVELGDRLVAAVGLADVFTRRDVREPGRLVLLVDGAEVAAATVGVDDGWVHLAAATRPGRAEVVFRLTAVGLGARDRRLCFAAEARR
jgi:hypothetical protein